METPSKQRQLHFIQKAFMGSMIATEAGSNIVHPYPSPIIDGRPHPKVVLSSLNTV